MRLFLALHLETPLRTALAELQGTLRRADRAEQVRWIDPDAIHLTLHFFGEVDPSRLPGIQKALGQATLEKQAPLLGLGRVGGFPSLGRPGVIWVGIEEVGTALGPLHAAIGRALRAEGWAPDQRAFQPHLTVGRVRAGDRRPARLTAPLAQVLEEARPTPVEPLVHGTLALVRSQLSPQGSRYEDLETWVLPAGEGGAVPPTS